MTTAMFPEIEVAPPQCKWPRYPTYKVIGQKWLEEIPNHWQIKRLKYLGSIRYGLGEPPALKHEGLPFIRATDIQRGKIDLETIQRVDPSDIPWSRDPGLRARDILVVRSGAYTGDSAIIPPELDCAIAGYDMVFRARCGWPQFIAYSLLSKYVLEGQIFLAKMRAAQPHLNAEELGGTLLALAPLEEQQAITAFLDRETARIDELIAKKQRLIELLQEKRQVLITHVVT